MHFRPHHVAFTVKNLDESVAWYVSKLGFRVINQFERPTRNTALLKKDDVCIELFGINNGAKPLPEYRKKLYDDIAVIGTKHLCIAVDDLGTVVSDLQKKGVEFVTEIDDASFGGTFIFLRDCNGILIELYQANA